MSCPVPLNLVCDAVGSATSSVSSSVLSAIAGWVVDGAIWLLDELGKVMTSSTTVNVQASWFLFHYKLMLAIAAVVAVPMLMLTAVQAVFQQNPSALFRAAFVHLPLAGVLTAAVVQLVELALKATDALCTVVSTGTGGELDKTFHSIGTVLSHEPLPLPTFVMTVGALLIVAGAFVLWLELLVRAAAIYAAVLFLPLALASLVWPAISHWCKRLTETLAALVLSKFVVVAVLSLAVGAVTSGDGFSTVLAGGALLLLAAFTPFTLLRLIPLMEVGAAMQLEGARQRVRAAWGRAPDSAVGFALRQAREHGAHRETGASPGTPGMPGTGMTVDPGSPGPSGSGPSGSLGSLGSFEAGGAGSAGLGDLAGGVSGAGAAATGAALATGGASLAAGGAGIAGGEGFFGGAGIAGGEGLFGGEGFSRGEGFSGGGEFAGGEGFDRGEGFNRGEGFSGGGEGAGREGFSGSGGGEFSGGGELSGGEGQSQFAVGPMPREWLPPGGLTAPPGTIPLWEGSPESVRAALDATKRPHRVEPDGYGGIIPGVPSPLWGGTEPLSRFEPGPKDDWGDWHLGDTPSVDPPPSAGSPIAGSQVRGAPPFIDWSQDRARADEPSDDERGAHEPGDAGTAGTSTVWRQIADRDGQS